MSAEHTPSSENPQAPPAAQPETDAGDATGDTSRSEVAAHDTDGPRTAEAGNQYTGRQMDDSLKANPRDDRGAAESTGDA